MTLADGAFDILHVGHLAYLRAAAALGRPLVVNIAPDDVIQAKGRVPFQSRAERAQMVWALDMVDQVRCQSLPSVIRALHPKYLAKGADWKGRLPHDVLAACRDAGTRIVYTDTQSKTVTERLRA